MLEINTKETQMTPEFLESMIIYIGIVFFWVVTTNIALIRGSLKGAIGSSVISLAILTIVTFQ